MAKHQNKRIQTRTRKPLKTRNTRKPSKTQKSMSTKGSNQYVSCYIVGHGCYLLSQFIIPNNMRLAYNTPINQPFCGDTTNVEWDPARYPHIIDTDTTNDCFLDFVDNTSDLFSSFGVYFNGQPAIYKGQKNVILSHVLNYISTLTTKPIRVYCSICRNPCSTEDGNKYNELTHLPPNSFEDISQDVLDDLAGFSPDSSW